MNPDPEIRLAALEARMHGLEAMMEIVLRDWAQQTGRLATAATQDRNEPDKSPP